MTTLKQWMTRKGISNNELARVLDVPPSAVSHFATGSRPVTDAFRWKFALRFGMKETEELFGAVRSDRTPEPA